MGSLLLRRPRGFATRADDIIHINERKYAFELGVPVVQEDEFNIALPAGLVVDELPSPAKISALGTSYTSETKMQGNTLAYKRRYQSEQVVIPLDKITEWNGASRIIAMDERNA